VPTPTYFQVPPNSTGAKIATESATQGADTVHFQVIQEYEAPTFLAIADRIVPAVNKYILTVFNTTSTRKVVIQKVFVYNWQTATATGTLLEQEFRRITARTVGSAITPVAYDTADTLTAGITADSTTTAVTDSSLIRRNYTSGEEVKIGALTLENSMGVDDRLAIVYEKTTGCKGLTCRQNQGVTIKNISGTAGTTSAVMLFTDEPV
jgi:hypothetical protein